MGSAGIKAKIKINKQTNERKTYMNKANNEEQKKGMKKEKERREEGT